MSFQSRLPRARSPGGYFGICGVVSGMNMAFLGRFSPVWAVSDLRFYPSEGG